jgi:hypothetical protein
MKVFILSFMYPNDGRWSGRLIGVYSSQTQTALAIERLGHEPEFRDFPRGFQVDAVELDEDFRDAIYFYSPPPPPTQPPPSSWN